MARKKKEKINEVKEILTPEDTRRLNEYVDASLAMFLEIDDRKEAQTELAQKLAEDFGWEKSEVMEIAKTAYKGSLRDKEQKMDRVRTALEAIGRGYDSEQAN
jgi:hypothetical protein